MKYRINGKEYSIDVSGKIFRGENECLLHSDDNLFSETSWNSEGYVVSPLVEGKEALVLKHFFTNLIRDAIGHCGGSVNDDFSLEKYHKYVPSDDLHLHVLNHIKNCCRVSELPLDYNQIDARVSRLCNTKVSCYVPEQIASGFFFVRIVRPQPHKDNNPPHKDVWIARLRNAINLYLPLAGSNEQSSLPLVPGSHFWTESQLPRTESGAEVDGSSFSVPSVIVEQDELDMIRPYLPPNNALFFSPYLIHGGAINANNDLTRVSLEMRFWRSR